MMPAHKVYAAYRPLLQCLTQMITIAGSRLPHIVGIFSLRHTFSLQHLAIYKQAVIRH